MFVTDCSISDTTISAEIARDDMVARGKASGVHQLHAMAALCHAADFDDASMKLPLNERQMFGDATDKAVLRFSESLGPIADLRNAWRRGFQLAFNSKNKFMIRTFSLAEKKGLELAVSEAEKAQWKPDD